MKDGTYRVGICGSYGGLNIGDEAILSCMIRRLRNLLPVEITVFSRNPEDTRTYQQVERCVNGFEFSTEEMTPEIQRLDLFVLGGGGILYDELAKKFMRIVSMAQDLGVPVMTWAVGAGPLTDLESRRVVTEGLNRSALITVREQNAKNILQEAGVVSPVVITADPAFLMEGEPFPEEALRNEGLFEKGPLIGFSIREPGQAAPDLDLVAYHDLVANVADYLVERYDAEIVFVPMERKAEDLQQVHRVISKMFRPERVSVLKGRYSPGQIYSLMNHFMFAVGMRLHFLIFAALQGVPFVALPYASKVSGFLESIGLSVPPIHKVNTGRTIAYLDESLDRSAGGAEIRDRIEELKRQALETGTLAADLLEKSVLNRSAGQEEV